ncbi:MAG: GNAT family N-acetyltransferase [Ignavibacteriales bacterium]|nr:GNAT family N-acetyltransferase [Ignavibacteriales bacterium]
MSSISVQPIQSTKERDEFIRLAWKIYEGVQFWVPPLLMDRRKLMDKEKNPFYKHAEAEFFLARKNGEAVGRIAAIINHNHNKEHNENIGFFGFFESINEQAVTDALVNEAKSWLKKRGVSAVRGPANPSVNDEYGLLVDGFELSPRVLMPYNPSYYPTLLENTGFRKVKDLYAYHLSQKTVYTEKFVRVNNLVQQKVGMTFRSINMKEFQNEIKKLKLLYNSAWQYNWGAVPMTDEEFDALAKDLKPVVEPELVIIAEYKGEPIGFALSLPDLNMALKKNKRGYLLPGLYCLVRYKKLINTVRIIVLGVKPEYLKTGAAAVLFYETAKRAKMLGYDYGEASWVLEDNVMMNRAAELMNAERDKTYRIYEQQL